MEIARREMAAAEKYQHHVINEKDDVDGAVRDVCNILTQHGN